MNNYVTAQKDHLVNKKNDETDKSSDAESSEHNDDDEKIEVIVDGKRSAKKACEFVGLKMPPIKSSLQMVYDQVSDDECSWDSVLDSD